MDTKHTIRPAWVLTVLPTWLIAGSIAAAVLYGAHIGLLPLQATLVLVGISLLCALIAQLRWWFGSRLEITQRRITYKGWPIYQERDGSEHRRYAEIGEPRSEWMVYEQRGILFPSMTCTCMGQPVTLEKVARPSRLKRLLTANESEFEQMASGPALMSLVLVGLGSLIVGLGRMLWDLSRFLARLLRETLCALARLSWIGSVKLYQRSTRMGGQALSWARQQWPYVRAAASQAVVEVRQLFARPNVPVAPDPKPTASILPSYADFLRFCRECFFEKRAVICRWAHLYIRILENAHMVQIVINGTTEVKLCDRIQSLEDIKLRIGQQQFEREIASLLPPDLWRGGSVATTEQVPVRPREN